MSIRDNILNANDRKQTSIEIDGWGLIHVKELTLADRLSIHEELLKKENEDRLLYVYAILFSVVDEQGNRQFSKDDYDLVINKNQDLVYKLGEFCSEFCKLVGKPIEEAKKN